MLFWAGSDTPSLLNKFIALVLSFILLFVILDSGCGNSARDGNNETVMLLPLTSEGDKVSVYNPDRGYRTEFCIIFAKTKKPCVKYDSLTIFLTRLTII